MITNSPLLSLQETKLKLHKQVEELLKKVDNLIKEKEDLKVKNDLLEDKNTELLAENVEFKRRLEQNSRNSHKPPSSDFPKQKPAFPKKIKKNKGGQLGHKGKTLQQIESPDRVIKYPIEACTCGHDLSELEQTVSEKRQVLDTPDPSLIVTEHQGVKVSCPNCGKQNRSEFPEHVNSPIQYGFGVKSLVVLLNNQFKLPFNKIQLLFSDLYGYAINEATISSANHLAYDRLKEPVECVREQIIASLVAHADETGVQINGVLHWLHNLSTEELTYLFVHQKRGEEALKSEESPLPDFKHYLVHDCWASYFKFEEVDHAICGAHLLRELEALIENKTIWAGMFKKFLLGIYDKSSPIIKNRKQVEDRYDLICRVAELEEPPPEQSNKKGKKKRTKGRNLLERLIKYKDAVLRFAFVPEVPFTNNLAERDIRHTKLKQKISGGFRTFKGAQIYARIQSYISSLRKQEEDVFTQLRQALEFKKNIFSETTPAK